MSLLADGDYPFTIRGTSDAPSKSTGKPMLTLKLLCYLPDGRSREVVDRIVPGTAYSDKKLFELCRATNLLDKYQAGALQAADLEGKEGWAKIGHEAGKPKSNGEGNFADKNKVSWYLKGSPGSPLGAATPAKPQPTERELANLPPAGAKEEDSDVPF